MSKSRLAKEKIRLGDTKPNMYGDVRGWILKTLRYQHSFQTLMEQHRIPYRHFQMISLFVDHIYEYEFKDQGGNYEKIRDECIEVIKNSHNTNI
ncbi:MAG: hypothetical protein CM15mV25_0070 [uncultured marine virus]|nr:MAG: hypothetical protein CM15mV25_0070 [uncultured marine virus]